MTSDRQRGLEGQLVGAYRLERVLGTGGSSTVYLGVDPQGERVAIKVLEGVSLSDADMRRFDREARVRMAHRNIVRVLDAGRTGNGTPYLALELLSGSTLTERFARETLSLRQVVDLAKQIAEGLAVAHESGVVHRDLKPDNLFCCDDGSVKVVDFGIALLEDNDTRVTTTGMVMGTPWYLSPEQARGDAVLDQRVDVWGLGAVLHEALTGRGPFDRAETLATVLAILREDLEPLETIAPHVPKPLAALVSRCLEKNRDDRFPGMRPILSALAALEDDSDLDVPVPRHSSARPPPRVSISRNEERVVAVVLAEGVSEPMRLARIAEEHGAAYELLRGNRAVMVFGGTTWEGDELERAVRAAVSARSSAAHLAVSAGRASNEGHGISGAALRAAEESCRARLDGVVVDVATARSLTRKYRFVPARDNLMRVIAPLDLRTRRSVAASAESSESEPTVDLVPVSLLVARDAELTHVDRAIEVVTTENRSAVTFVRGPIGVGKSRLASEVIAKLDAADPPFVVLVAEEGRRAATSLSMFASVLQRLATTGLAGMSTQYADKAPLSVRRRAVAELAHLAIEDEALAEESQPFLGMLLSVPMPETVVFAAARDDAQLMADRLRLAIRDVFAGLARQGPLALVIDDIDALDAASRDLVAELAVDLEAYPFFLFATARSEGGPLLAKIDATTLELRGLHASEIIRLARGLTGADLDDEMAKRLAERTGGNPLFVEQILLELDPSIREGDAPLPLPLSVEAAVQSRLDALPHYEKEAVKQLAVLAREGDLRELEQAFGEGTGKALDSLVRRGLVSAATSFADKRLYRLRSTLTRDVAYRLLSADARAAIHRVLAATLEHGRQRDLEEVAHHHAEAGAAERAAHFYTEAALAAALRADGTTVLRCAQRAIDLGVPRDRAFELAMARAETFFFAARFDDQRKELATALELAATPADRARAHIEEVGALFQSGARDAALAAAEHAVAEAALGEDEDLIALAHVRLGLMLALVGGKAEQANATLAVARDLSKSSSFRTRGLLAAAESELAGVRGDLRGRAAALERAVHLYEEAGNLRRGANSENNLASLYNHVGQYERARDALVASTAKCRRVGHRVAEAYGELNLGYTWMRLGESEEAAKVLSRALELAESARVERLRVLARLNMLRLRLVSDDVDRVERARGKALVDAAKEAVALAARLGLRIERAEAFVLLARAQLAAGDREGALESSTSALSLRDTIGAAEHEDASFFSVHAAALAALGHDAEAVTTRERGRAIVRERAARIHDEEWRSSFERIPEHAALLAS